MYFIAFSTDFWFSAAFLFLWERTNNQVMNGWMDFKNYNFPSAILRLNFNERN